MILFFKKLFKLLISSRDLIYICSFSSLSSQLGFATTLQYYLKTDQEVKTKNKIFIMLQFPTKIDPNCKSNIDFKNLNNCLKLRDTNKFEILKVNNNLSKIFVYLFIKIKILIHKNFSKTQLFLVQPRPYWLKEQFKKFPFINNLEFDNYLLVGDGFLSLEIKARPFWLDKKGIKNIKPNFKKYLHIYYMYNVNKSYDKYLNCSNFQMLEAVFVRRSIRYINENKLIRIAGFLKVFLKEISHNNQILIYPGTTFYETKRASLEDEVNLYDEYLKKMSRNLDLDSILFKPHPGSSIEKLQLISEKTIWGNNINKEIKIYEEISNLPLEILIDLLLLSNKNLKIYLPICSSGSLSTLIIYPDKIYPLKAFGRRLISKYISKKYVNPRLDQEKRISQNVDKLKIKFANKYFI